MFLDRNFGIGKHAGTEQLIGIGQLDFSQHGFGGIVERVREAGDGAIERFAGQFVYRDFDGQAINDEGHFMFRDGNLDADFAEISEADDGGTLRRTAGAGGGNESADIDEAAGDNTGEGSTDPGKIEEGFDAFEVRLGNFDFALGFVEGLGDDEIGRFGASFLDALEIEASDIQFGFVFAEIGEEFRDFDECEQSALFDFIAFIDANFFDVTGDLGEERGLLKSEDIGGESNVARNLTASGLDELDRNGRGSGHGRRGGRGNAAGFAA